MNQEIKVGSKWVLHGRIVTIVHVNIKQVVYEHEDLDIQLFTKNNFLNSFTPYIEPKPPLKVEAWVRDDRIVFYREGCDVASGYTREPRLDYEVV